MTETAEQSGPRMTLSRIAAEAMVSVSSVSKVLNGRPGVSLETRERIEELLDRNGYMPRRSDRAFPPLIDIVFAEIDTAWAVEIIRGVEQVASENGMGVVVSQSGDRYSPGSAWVESVLNRRTSGVILVLSDLPEADKQRLRTRSIPFVIVDPSGDPAPDVPSIGSANWNGGFLAARHLIDQGHREIGMITGPSDMMCSRARFSGYRAALESAGIPFREDYVRVGSFHHRDGVEHGRALLERADRPTAIFAGSDLQALGVYEAARALGLGIPGDISIVGYDDLNIAQWAGPPLTTVRQPLVEMAEEAARLVLRLRDGQRADSLRIDLATQLVVRESTRSLS